MTSYEVTGNQLTNYQQSVQAVQQRIDGVWAEAPQGSPTVLYSTIECGENTYKVEDLQVRESSTFLNLTRYRDTEGIVIADVVLQGQYLPSAMGEGVGGMAYIVIDGELHGYSPTAQESKPLLQKAIALEVNEMYIQSQKSPDEIQAEYEDMLMREEDIKNKLLDNAFRFATYPIGNGISSKKDIRGVEITEADKRNSQRMFDNLLEMRFDPKIEFVKFGAGSTWQPKLISAFLLSKLLDDESL